MTIGDNKAMENEKTTKDEKETAGSCPPAMNCYMVDSSFYQHRNRGGRKFHLGNGNGGTICGEPLISEETETPWDGLPIILKCKKCAKKLYTCSRCGKTFEAYLTTNVCYQCKVSI